MGTSYGTLTQETARSLGYFPADVYLDGVLVKRVVNVSDINGWVEVYEKDANGFVRVDADGLLVLTRLFGDVIYVPSGVKLKDLKIDKVAVAKNDKRIIYPIVTATFKTNHIYIPLTSDEAKLMMPAGLSDYSGYSLRVETTKETLPATNPVV